MYLSAKSIDALAAVRKVHFLNDEAVRMNKSLGDAVGLQALGVHIITVEPGHFSTEYHFHHFEEECVYILSGVGIARIGEETHTLGPGDFLGFPTNRVPHAMQATGSEPLVCLVVGQRLKQDVSDYPEAKVRLYRNNGVWDLVKHTQIERVDR